MTLMELVLYPDPVLRRRAAPIQAVDDEVRRKAREMFDIMYREKGVGLAAPQVGWSVRLFVVNALPGSDPAGEKVYINPELEAPPGSVDDMVDEEGCLSIPGVRGNVARHRQIRVRAMGLDGQPFGEELEDLGARVFQHELDHLDGILFITRLNTTERMLAGKSLKKLEKEHKERLRSGR